MPKYIMCFDTISGEAKYNVDIDEEETFDAVLEEILFDLRERGGILKGEGEPTVTWGSTTLDCRRSLPEQGVRPSDVLRLSSIEAHQEALSIEDDFLAVAMIGDHLRLVTLSADGTYAVVDEAKKLHNIIHVWSTETQALKLAINELESLINDPKAKEQDIQDFFEKHPNLIKGEEHRAAHPHVILSPGTGDLIPDFILEPHDPNQLCDVLELKLPTAKLFTLKKNREGLSAAVLEGCRQLRLYAQFFDDGKHRELISELYRLHLYQPKMFLIIGRTGEVDPVRRKKIMVESASVELRTYDDILLRAKISLAAMESGRWRA